MSQKLVLAPASTTVDNIVTFDTITGQIKDGGPFDANIIVQTVTAIYTSVDSTTSSTFSSTGLTANITPTSSSNKIVVFTSIPTTIDDNVGGTTNRYYRGRTRRTTGTAATLAESASGLILASSGSDFDTWQTMWIIAEETAPSTSSHTYVHQFAVANSGNQVAELDGSANKPAFMLIWELKV